MIGSTLNNFRILEKLGAGGQGTVYKAVDSKLGRTVVIKVLPADLTANSASLKRFEREAQLCSSLDHPNICTIFDFGEAHGVHFIAMQYVEGKNVRQLVAGRALELKSALSIGIQVADALACAHARGIIHRDVKAGNVMVTDSGQVKVLDFGLAKLLDDGQARASGIHRTDLTEIGIPYGTATYAAPEQARGEKVDNRADIFSTGVLLYELLTGIWPFQGKTSIEVRYAVLKSDPKPLSEARAEPVPARLQKILDKAMAKDPRARYQKVEELRDELRAVLDELSGAAGASGQIAPRHMQGAGPVKRALGWLMGRKEDTFGNSQAASQGTLHAPPQRDTSSDLPLRAVLPEEKKSIAILPFRNLSHDTAVAFYEFSLADALITELAKLSSVVVRPSSVIAKYQNIEIDPRDAGRELNVSAVLSAGFLRGGDRLRVTAQLLDVDTGDLLWSDRVDADSSDIIALQDTITHQIVNGLKLELSAAEKGRLAQRPTNNVEAYEEYLRARDHFGRFIFRSLDPKDCDAAIANFERAIELDSDFALAYSGLGACFANRVFKGIGNADDYTRAESAFCAAIQHDPLVVEARMLMVFIYLSRGEKQKARAAVKRLQEEAPNDGSMHFVKATLHRLDGQYDEALKSWERLGRLDPAARVVASYNRARIFTYQGRYDDALLELDRGAEIEPDHPLIHVFRARALYYKGQVSEAVATLRQVLAKNPAMDGVRPILSTLLCAQGRLDEARDQLTPKVSDIAMADHDMSYWMASAYAMLGERDEAFTWLERSVGLGNENHKWFEADRNLESLRDDNRFHQLIRQIKEQTSAIEELRKHATQRPEDAAVEATASTSNSGATHHKARAEAYEEYLLGRDAHGRFIYHTLDVIDSNEAIAHFERALELDADFSLAHCALGGAYVNRVIKFYGTPSDFALAAPQFDAALAHDPKQLEARLHLVFILLYRGEKAKAHELTTQLLSETPNDVGVHFVAGTLHRLDGEYNQALDNFNRMLRLNPAERVVVSHNRARIFMCQGRPEDAALELDVALDIEPDHPMLKVFRALLFLRNGKPADAERLLTEVTQKHPAMFGIRPLLAQALYAQNRNDAARQQLTPAVEACADADADVAFWLAGAFAMAVSAEPAFKWIERSIQLGYGDRRWLESHEAWSGLRADERFAQLLERLQ